MPESHISSQCSDGYDLAQWDLSYGTTTVKTRRFGLDAGKNPKAYTIPTLQPWNTSNPSQIWYYTNDNHIALQGAGECMLSKFWSRLTTFQAFVCRVIYPADQPVDHPWTYSLVTILNPRHGIVSNRSRCVYFNGIVLKQVFGGEENNRCTTCHIFL